MPLSLLRAEWSLLWRPELHFHTFECRVLTLVLAAPLSERSTLPMHAAANATSCSGTHHQRARGRLDRFKIPMDQIGSRDSSGQS